MNPYRISTTDRTLFKRCRRAWDLGACARGNYEATDGQPQIGLRAALLDALAVYYFPGMWEWQRDIVVPLVHQGLDRACASSPAAVPDDDLRAAHGLLDRYARWAPAHDAFTPVQVAAEVEVNIPDPVLSDRDLTTVDGDPVRLVTYVDGLVFGADNRPWLLSHRLEVGGLTDPDLLALDQAALTNCWAWQESTLDARMAGLIFNLVRLDHRGTGDGPEFRRTVVPTSGEELTLLGRQLAYEAMEMLDAGLALYPNPSPGNCAPCPFRAPCLAMQQGRDPGPDLAAGYRKRHQPAPVEGRLGGRTWSMSRGARPNRFGST